MKKYTFLIFVLILSFLARTFQESYAYHSCDNKIVRYNNLNSLTLKKHLEQNYPSALINNFCSYNECYYVRNESITKAINNFLALQKKKSSEEYNLEVEVKGFPITEISFNLCE